MTLPALREADVASDLDEETKADFLKALRAKGASLRAMAASLGVSASLLGQRLRAEGHAGLLVRIADAGALAQPMD